MMMIMMKCVMLTAFCLVVFIQIVNLRIKIKL